MKPKALSTQDLKERGWTPAIIRDLLGRHDRERQNDLRVGRSGRRVDAPVKLYLEERVLQAETTEAFARAQDRARLAQDAAAKAQATKEARYAQQLEAHAAAPLPTLTAHPDAAGMTRQQLWEHHLAEHWEAEYAHDDLLDGLPPKLRLQARNAWYTRFRAAIYALYGWPEAGTA